ncbi:hypothetical protein AAEO56_14790 [Flavobacterium sp. DGU11]|uniref:DUF998 domain-containing protein n=1 Tax=Flavobacterium arundinis TaxID=3139143 RepID=A0ABU9HZE9_9FLAO
MIPSNQNGKQDPELISYQQLRKLIGVLGLLLPIILLGGHIIGKDTAEPYFLDSISHYYYSVMGDVFVGILCAIAIFLFTYKGYPDGNDNIAGNLACLFALCVAFFPTSKDSSTTTVSVVHYIGACLFFAALGYYCLVLFTKSKGTLTEEKKKRNKIFRSCGYIIVGCIVLLAAYRIPAINEILKDTCYFLVLEIVALWAFGISWLVKGEVILKD